MLVVVNGQPQELPESSNLTALISIVAPVGPFAVAHNGDFVPRTAYAERTLTAEDRIDIVQAAAGG